MCEVQWRWPPVRQSWRQCASECLVLGRIISRATRVVRVIATFSAVHTVAQEQTLAPLLKLTVQNSKKIFGKLQI